MRTRKPVLTPYGLLSLSEKLSERAAAVIASAAGAIKDNRADAGC